MPSPRKKTRATVALPAQLSQGELDRIVSLNDAVEISSLSEDVWRREHADKIIRLSSRRVGILLRDALFLDK